MPEHLHFAPAERAQSAQARISQLAGRQSGVVARSQLERCGLSGSAISRWAAQGRLHRIHRGIYAVGHPRLYDRGRATAALLYAGPGAALSHQTAGWWWRMIEATPRRIHVVSRRRCPSLSAVSVHPRRNRDRVHHDGLPVTTPSQTLLDLASILPSPTCGERFPRRTTGGCSTRRRSSAGPGGGGPAPPRCAARSPSTCRSWPGRAACWSATSCSSSSAPDCRSPRSTPRSRA